MLCIARLRCVRQGNSSGTSFSGDMAVASESLVASPSWRDLSRLLLPALLDMSSAPGMDRPERGFFFCDLDCPFSFFVRLGEARGAGYVLKCVVISELSELSSIVF